MVDLCSADFLVLPHKVREIQPVLVGPENARAVDPPIRQVITDRSLKNPARPWHAMKSSMHAKVVSINL